MSQKASAVTAPIQSNHDAARIDYNANTNPPTTADPSSAFNSLSSLIVEGNKLRFTSAGRLARQIERKLQKCIQDKNGCYLLVTGVSKDEIQLIDNAFRNLNIFRQVRCTYEQPLQSLIIRLMPGAAHENTSGSFIREVERRIAVIPGHSWYSFRTVGSTRFAVPGTRSKEGDQGIKPTDTRKAEEDWPTLMVEVGDSQSLALLQTDACWWLIHSGGKTKMVIIIKITKRPHSIRLERWKMMPHPNKIFTRSRTSMIPQFDQFFDIDAAGTITHDPAYPDLILPYEYLFDTRPASATDIIILKNELSLWALHVFDGLN
ncbi:hypothetical protein HOY80DRAFT_1054113 [Tuber brumale]|nr:hypothetical protein HOY80DRAFT_1054113 [Tuber brumale]